MDLFARGLTGLFRPRGGGGASGIGASTGAESLFDGSFGGGGVLDCETRMPITTTTIVNPAPRNTNHRSSFDFIGVILNDL